MSYKDPSKRKEYREKYREKNNEWTAKYREELKQHVLDSIASGEIIDQHKWDVWCVKLKRGAKKHPFSADFTNDTIFKMLIKRCFYCGDISTTIDRIDSNLDHTPGNCVASCYGCNVSKSDADSSTFIRKAYYRTRGKYVDDNTNIWFVYKQKPAMWHYKRSAEKKEVRFELSNEEFDKLVNGDCEYCHRSPTTWFGIDRVKPEKGYVNGNVVSCCWDCNLDKHTADVDTMIERNELIATRVDTCDLIIDIGSKNILHEGRRELAKRTCAYGQIYQTRRDASRALGKSDNYVCKCIRDGRYFDDIFEVSKDFYDFVIENKLDNITKKMYILFDRM